MGFLPQFVDLNGDGREDLITGSYYGDLNQEVRVDGSERYDENGDYWGDIFVFYCNEDGSYQPRQVLTHALMHPTPFPIDWDNDGDSDFVTVSWATGSYEGVISLMENIGTKERAEFAYPTPLIKSGDYACVVPYDWDQDGLVDLVASGYMEGSIYWIKNEGTEQEYKFGEPVTLIQGREASDKWHAPVTEEVPWGMSLQLHLVDWDGDGVIDVLAGDNASFRKAKPNLSDDQSEELAAALKQVEEFNKALEESLSNGDAEGEMPEYPMEADELIYQSTVIEGHGRVWVFRGQVDDAN